MQCVLQTFGDGYRDTSWRVQHPDLIVDLAADAQFIHTVAHFNYHSAAVEFEFAVACDPETALKKGLDVFGDAPGGINFKYSHVRSP